MRMRNVEKELKKLYEQQRETNVLCKNILTLLKKQEKENIEEYKVFSSFHDRLKPVSYVAGLHDNTLYNTTG